MGATSHRNQDLRDVLDVSEAAGRLQADAFILQVDRAPRTQDVRGFDHPPQDIGRQVVCTEAGVVELDEDPLFLDAAHLYLGGVLQFDEGVPKVVRVGLHVGVRVAVARQTDHDAVHLSDPVVVEGGRHAGGQRAHLLELAAQAVPDGLQFLGRHLIFEGHRDHGQTRARRTGHLFQLRELLSDLLDRVRNELFHALGARTREGRDDRRDTDGIRRHAVA